MSNIMDNICKLRDMIAAKDYKKLVYSRKLFNDIFEEVHRNMARKAKDDSHPIEFTSQDLRELTEDIRAMLKRWEGIMCPDKAIKSILKASKIVDGKRQLNIDDYCKKALAIMPIRRDLAAPLYELLNLLEYHSVYLYFLEEISDDSFAVDCTERLTA